MELMQFLCSIGVQSIILYFHVLLYQRFQERIKFYDIKIQQIVKNVCVKHFPYKYNCQSDPFFCIYSTLVSIEQLSQRFSKFNLSRQLYGLKRRFRCSFKLKYFLGSVVRYTKFHQLPSLGFDLIQYLKTNVRLYN